MSAVPSRIGPYRVERELARGGMGIVYLARDTRLDRPAALKALPDDFLSDPDRLLRFEREAKVLAALSHPNIAGIYGVEEFEGRRYLALEYVEGETLAQRLARGPLEPEDAISICVQIAAGIEAAHEGGIIHRDLKPGNVMITPRDEVKVVDFGLAKGKLADWEERPPGSPQSPVTPDSPTAADSPVLPQSPAIGSPMTLPGVILGTAAYLSPEQARGKPVDRRTDIWSFGCVLYECLTGRRAFEGASVPEVIGRVLRGEVDWGQLPPGTPPRLRELLERCFEKDPKKRLRDMGDARLTLEEIGEGRAVAGAGAEAAVAAPPMPRSHTTRIIAFAAAFALLCTAAGIALWNNFGPGRGGGAGSETVKRLSIPLPPDFRAIVGWVTPDGQYVIVMGSAHRMDAATGMVTRLYRRRIDGDRFEVVVGSDHAIAPNYSNDGRSLYFLQPISSRSAALQLLRAPMAGGAAPVAVAAWNEAWDVTSWLPLNSGDVLVGIRGGNSYVRVSGTGAVSSGPTKILAPGFAGRFSLWNELPRGRGVLVNTTSWAGGGFQMGTGVLDPSSGRAKQLLRDGGNAWYSPTGHLLFARRSTLLAVPFDLARLEIKGEPVPVAEELLCEESYGHGQFALSLDGTLSYIPGGVVGERRHLIVADRQGRVRDWSGERAFIGWPIVASAGGNRVAYSITNARGIDELWVSERGRVPAQRIVAVPGVDCSAPAWSPDGTRLAYFRAGADAGGVYVQPLDGGAPRRISRADSLGSYSTMSWAPDGSALVATKVVTQANGTDIVRVPVRSPQDPPSIAEPLISDPDALERRPSFSPDGRWIAYESNQSGRPEIYVARYSPGSPLGRPLLVSSGGGFDPRWGRGGQEIFYQNLDVPPHRRVMSVALDLKGDGLSATPAPRWNLDDLRVTNDTGAYFDLLPDGSMVAIRMGEEEGEVSRIEVVLNFFEELRQKMRATANP